MKETFVRLLNSYVKPDHPKVLGFNVSMIGAGDKVMYVVIAKTRGYDFDREERNELRNDVYKVFSSMNFPEGSDFMISYKSVD